MDPRQSNDDLDFSALARLFAGELPADEAAALRSWIDEDPDRHELVARLHDVWERAGSLGQPWNAEAGLRDIRRKAQTPSSPEELPFRRPATRRGSTPGRMLGSAARRPRTWRQPAAAAAAVLLVAMSALWWLTTGQHESDAIAMAEVVTGRSERGELRLPDGSRVVLGVQSRLRYPEQDRDGSRDVYLTGAAHFEVARNVERPFRVHTDHGVAEVLGTRFGVRAYAGTPATEVAMVEGVVALGPPLTGAAERESAAAEARTSERAVLRAGDVGVIDATGAVQVEHDADVDRRIAWTDGRLVFQDTPLRDVAAELARWYDVDIQITDSALATQPVTASFHREPIAQVLVVVASAVDARYERAGRTVTLSPTGGVR